MESEHEIQGMSGNEFALIRRFFANGYPQSADTLLAVGDDASIVTPPAGVELVQSIDTQVADVHFPAAAPAHLIAARALRCAASDLAAMGATPPGFHLAFTLPDADSDLLEAFAAGLSLPSHHFYAQLILVVTHRVSHRCIRLGRQCRVH